MSNFTNQSKKIANVEFNTPYAASIAAQGEPTKAGMEFKGWTLVPGGDESTKFDTTDTTQTMPDRELWFYAIWEPVYYTVTTIGANGTTAFAVDGDNPVDSANTNKVYDRTTSGAMITAGTQLRALGIPAPYLDETHVFSGWQIKKTDGTMEDVTQYYSIQENVKLYPKWNDLNARTVTYVANFPDGLAHTGTAPTDGNHYTLGARVIIREGKSDNGTALSITRKDVDNHDYEAPFAYWNTKPDGSGQSYYPGNTFVFYEDSVDDAGLPLTELTLYAIYSQYRETVLTYHKNADDAVFKQADENWTAQSDNYDSAKLKNGQVEVLYRDEIRNDFQRTDMIPNATFPVGQDRDGEHFTVVRTDDLGNTYIFAGWSTDQYASIPLAQNGDHAYVNTIKDDQGILRNTLYAIWGICKVVDKYGTEHVFDTIQKAVNFISTSDLITGKTGTIEMLVDYNKPNSDAVTIPADCTVTLTTARTGTLRYNGTTNSVITRAQDGASMLENNGTLTLTDITLDGASGTYTLPTEGGIIKTNANSTLNVNSGTTIRNSKAEKGGGIYVLNGASVSVTDASFSNCEATVDGGAIYVYTSGSLTVNGGTSFTSCKAIGGIDANNLSFGNGGGIFSEGTLNLLGTAEKPITFTECNANRDGGGVRTSDANHDVVMQHCEFNQCRTIATSGGGAFIFSRTLNMSDCTFTGCSAGWCGGGFAFQVGTATVADCAVSNCSAYNGGGVFADNSANIAINNSTIYDCTALNNGGALCLLGNAVATENGLLIDGHSSLALTDNDETNKTQASGATANAVRGGGIYVDSNAQFTFTGGELIKLKASGDGGAIYNKGTIVMTEDPALVSSGNLKRGSLEYCSATNGGAIYNDGTGTIDMTGGYIEHCMASGNGGGIYTASTATQTVGGNSVGAVNLHSDSAHPGVINNCSAAGNGGGIYLAAGELDMSGGEIVGCSAANGGGVYLAAGTTMKLDELTSGDRLLRGSIESCTASSNGGGIYVTKDSTLTMNGGAIEHCSATSNGGGIFNGGTFTMTNTSSQPGVIDDCHAVNGGGIYLGRVSTDNDISIIITITGGTIQNCYATANGGAIYDDSKAKIELNDVTINGHTDGGLNAGTKNAVQGGGIYLPQLDRDYTSSLTLTGCNLYNLTAAQGGAIFSNRRSLNPEGIPINPETGVPDPTIIPVTTGCTIDIIDGEVNGHFDGFDSSQANAGNGGMLYLGNGAVDIQGTSIKNCTVAGNGDPSGNLTAGSGGVIFNVGNGHPNNDGTGPTVYMKNVTIDGGGLTNAQNGGAIFMKMAILSLKDCTLKNLSVTPGTVGGGKGAAIFGYTNAGGNTPSKITISGGHIENNTASGTGGGAINVVSGYKVSNGAVNAMSSTVSFEGDAVVYNNGTINSSGNVTQQKNMVLELDQLNSNNGVIQTTAAGLGADAHIGVYVVGDDSTNPYQDHGQSTQPFGTVQGSDTSKQYLGGVREDGTLYGFTNDRSDQKDLDSLLYGTKEGYDDDNLIYWSGSTGSRKVILRKVDGSDYTSLKGAKFNVYKGTATSPYVVKDKNKVKPDETLSSENLTSLDSGVFWVGELPYGVYYLEETQAPNGYNAKWFYLVIGADIVPDSRDGIFMSGGFVSREKAKEDYETYHKPSAAPTP